MTDANIWVVILLLGIGTFLIRFSFLGLIGDRAMPDWLLRHLRYTAVAVLPALVAPLVVFPAATGGSFEPARAAAALATLGVGYATRNVIGAILTGLVVLYSGLAATGAI